MKSSEQSMVIRSLVKKEFIQVLRDLRMRGILFGSPLMLLLIFGYAVNTDIQTISVAVHDEDRTATSRSLISSITNSGFFILKSISTNNTSTDQIINSAEADALLHIPRGFSKDIKTGQTTRIQLILDGTDSNRAAMINAYLTQLINSTYFHRYANRVLLVIVNRMSGQERTLFPQAGIRRPPQQIQIVERAFFNPQLSSTNFFLPGVIALLISLITTMLTSMSIVKEREIGTIEQMIVSPITPIQFMLGKTIPFIFIGIFDLCIVTLISIAWFQVPFNGSFLFLVAASLIFIISTLSVGLFISTISKTQQQAMLSFFLFFIPAILFSGFIFPIYSMPKPIQVIAYFNPLTYFVIIMRAIFLKGSSPLLLWKELLILGLMGSVLLVLSAKRFKKRIE